MVALAVVAFIASDPTLAAARPDQPAQPGQPTRPDQPTQPDQPAQPLPPAMRTPAAQPLPPRARPVGPRRRAPAKRFNLDRWELAVGPTVLKEHGFGIAARILGKRFGIEVGAAYMPWLIAITGACTFADIELHAHYDAAALFSVANIKDRMRILIKAGGGWQDTIGMDVRAGAAFNMYFSDTFVLDVGAGLQVVPGAGDALKRIGKENCPGGTVSQADQDTSVLQPYIGATGFLRF